MALQALYRIEITGDESGEGIELLWHELEASPGDARRFAAELVRGVIESRDDIDGFLREAAQHWKLERLSRVDLTVLRIATLELMRHRETPTSVVLDEAIEIARRFGSEDSGPFVHGILDAVAGRLGVREPQPPVRES